MNCSNILFITCRCSGITYNHTSLVILKTQVLGGHLNKKMFLFYSYFLLIFSYFIPIFSVPYFLFSYFLSSPRHLTAWYYDVTGLLCPIHILFCQINILFYYIIFYSVGSEEGTGDQPGRRGDISHSREARCL